MRHAVLLFAIAVLAVVALLPPPHATSVPTAPGPETRRPMLWRLEGDTPVYLFGTIHLPDERVTDLLGVVEDAFEGSDVFYAEIALEPGAAASVQHLLLLPGEPWLDEQVGPETWARIQKALEGGQIATPFLKHMRPWVVGIQLLQKAMAPPTHGHAEADEAADDENDEVPPQPMDLTLYQNATAAGKDTGGLETLEEQIDVFNSLTDEEQIEMLHEMLDVVEGQQAAAEGGSGTEESAKAEAFTEEIEGMIRLYRTGDIDGVAKLVRASVEAGGETTKKFMTRLIDDRNVRMADRILAARAKHAGRTIFVAVGAGHYPGKLGILQLLRDQGHTVRRLEAGSEIEQSVEVK